MKKYLPFLVIVIFLAIAAIVYFIVKQEKKTSDASISLFPDSENTLSSDKVSFYFPKEMVNVKAKVSLRQNVKAPRTTYENYKIISEVVELCSDVDFNRDFDISFTLSNIQQTQDPIIAFWVNNRWQEIPSTYSGAIIKAKSCRTGYWAVLENVKPAVLFIHGLGGSNHSWDLLKRSLIDSGNYKFVKNYDFKNPDSLNNTVSVDKSRATIMFTINLSDNQNLTFNEQGEEVNKCVNSIIEDYDVNKVILVGHSMGGLAACAYMQNYGCEYIAGYMSVTTPHKGSFLALIQRHYMQLKAGNTEWFDAFAKNYLSEHENSEPDSSVGYWENIISRIEDGINTLI
ncbi:esterase/lipase family protein, partial [Candidatus Venteria ishoeyi]|uniref:esterase/lipase family protein n=1 Tax=Candidatus Venteria ishoeyi TaxID=1899563 RepID=UPI0011B09015